MSEEKLKHSDLTRRNFIKAGAIGSTAVGVAATGMLTFGNWIERIEASDETNEYSAYTFHQQTCGGHCSLKCTVREGRLCLIEPNDTWADDRYRTVCVKGLSEIQQIYSVDRIQTPMKRVGERGSGEFISITWDEAMQITFENLEKIWVDHGKDAVVAMASNDTRYPFIHRILGAQMGQPGGFDVGVSSSLFLSHDSGIPSYVAATTKTTDWVNAKTLINIGCNFLETSIVQNLAFFEAKEAGCNIVTIDPHFSTTAAKSNQWIPITPGTDTALLLGMITHILDNKLYDEEFVLNDTNYTFLVGVEDGLLLRDHELSTDPLDPDTGETNPYLVWDSITERPVPYNDALVKPVLEGSFEIEGKSYTTVFSKMVENQKQYSVDWAAKITGVTTEKIRELAGMYAIDTPATMMYGWGGPDKFAHSDVLGHAMACLVGLTGNIGKPGAGVGNYSNPAHGARPVYWCASFNYWRLPSDFVAAPMTADSVSVLDLPYVENNVHAILSFGDKMMQLYGNLSKAREWFKTLDFILYCDVYKSATADFADIILPASSKFENFDRVGGVKHACDHVLLNEKIIDPLFESKPDFYIEHEFAARVGASEHMPKTPEDLVRYQIDNPTDPFLEGITVEKLLENQGIMPYSNGKGVTVGFTDHRYGTNSGKFEVYFQRMLPFDQALPSFVQALEAYEGNELRNTYPLQLHNAHTRFFLHNQFIGATWIRQFREAVAELNPLEIEARGLKAGEIVEIFNDRGSCQCKLISNNAMRPGSVALTEGVWDKYMVKGNMANLTNNTITDRGRTLSMGPTTPHSDTLVEVRKAEVLL